MSDKSVKVAANKAKQAVIIQRAVTAGQPVIEIGRGVPLIEYMQGTTPELVPNHSFDDR
jgi:hypothetical protein